MSEEAYLGQLILSRPWKQKPSRPLYSISSVALYVASRFQRFTAERFNVVINSGEEVESVYMYTGLRSRRHSDGESENNFFIENPSPLSPRGPPASDSSGAAS